MSSTVLVPIANALKAKLETLTAASESVKGYASPPRDLDSAPCGVVEIPTIERVDPDAAESQLSTNDWHLTYPVTLYCDLSEAAYSVGQAIEFVENWIAALDDDPQLASAGLSAGVVVLDCKVVSAEPLILEDEARPMIAYETTVGVWALVA